MDYCGWAAFFCYSFKLQLCCLVIGCCWSSFVLDLLQDVATTKDYAEVAQSGRRKINKHLYSSKFLRSKCLVWFHWGWICGDKSRWSLCLLDWWCYNGSFKSLVEV